MTSMNHRATRFRRMLTALLLSTACGGEGITDVEPTPASLSLDRLAVSFSMMEGESDPAPVIVAIANRGETALTALSAAVQYRSGNGWLDASLAGASAPTSLTIAAKASSLVPGTYEADVTVTGSARNSPQTVAVVLTVEALPPTSEPRIALSHSSVDFAATAGGASPGSNMVGISNSGGGTLDGLSTSVAYDPGQPSGWLTVVESGSTAPATLTVGATVGSLPAGTYGATISVASPKAVNGPLTIDVTFEVTENGLADLLVEGGITISGPVQAGSSVTVEALEVRNQGAAAASAVSVGLYLSSDAAIDPSDQLIAGMKAIGSLAPGASISYAQQSVLIPAATSPGDYHLGVLVDRLDQTAESDESNNYASAPLSVLANGGGTTTYTLTVQSNPAAAGTVQGALPLSDIVEGEQVTLTAVPDAGYEFERWSGSVTGTSNPVTLTMDADKSVQANFRLVQPVLQVTATDGRVEATWTHEWPCDYPIGRGCLATSQDHYELEESTTSQTSGYQVIFSSATTRASPFTQAFNRRAGTYHYRVRAVGNGWTGRYSEPVTVVVTQSGPTPPAAPSSLSAQVSGQDVRLTWSDNSSDETGFTIQWSRSASFSGAETLDIGANLSSFDLFDDEAPETWYLRIRAFNTAGPSAWSNVVSVTTTVPTTRLNFVNASSYPVVSVQIDGVEQVTQPGTGIASGASSFVDVSPGAHSYYVANGFWDGTSRFSMYQLSGQATLQAGQTVDVVFEDPTIQQLLTRFSQGGQAYWDGSFIQNGNFHLATLRFTTSGWSFSVDGTTVRSGSYSLAGRYPGGQYVDFNLIGWVTGTLWETLGFISVEVAPGIIAQFYPR